MMKALKQLFFAATVTLCFSLAASAQKQDDQKRPPKNPPEIIVKDKDKDKPKGEKPKNDNKDKGNKPLAFIWENEGGVGIIYI